MDAPGQDSTSYMSSLGAWKSLLKTVSSFRGDLSAMTAPPFILSPVSQLEYTHYWFQNAEVFLAAARAPTEEERFLCVISWAFQVMNMQYTQRNQTEGYEKKPLNPFLGELFVAKLDEAILAAEQVSHHPPVSAFKIWTKDGAASCEGHVGIKAKFNTTIQVEQRGKTVYRTTVGGKEEVYELGLPSAHIEGFLQAAPFMELDGKTLVTSNTGYSATLSFSGAGWVSGKKHTVKVQVSKGDQLLYTIRGHWHKQLTIKNEATGDEKLFLDCTTSKSVEAEVRPLEQQDALESRKAWCEVAEAIRRGDIEQINIAKSKLENSQRALRVAEKEADESWQQRWFDRVGDDWKFNEQKFAADSIKP